MAEILAQRYLSEYQTKTDPLLRNYLSKKIKEASQIGNLPRDLLKRFFELARRGKKIRGALVVLGYEVAGGKNTEAIFETSLFIELFHTGVLVHDDIMDQDDFRRGIPALHRQFEAICKGKTRAKHFGQSMAICAGDLGTYLSWEKLLEGKFPKAYLLKAGKCYSQFVTRLIYGQTLDIAKTWGPSRRRKDILRIHRYKTAEYSGVLPLIIGATLAGMTDQKKFQALKQYGFALGRALQIRDDILGIFGERKELGKPIGSDIREGKKTLLMHHLARHGTAAQREFQRRILGNKSIKTSDIAKIRRILKEAGSYHCVVDLGLKYVAQGKKAIPKITKNLREEKILESLLVYMMARRI